jgi:hypothetical protein
MSLTEPLNGRVNGHSATVLRMPAESDSGDPADRFTFVYSHQILLLARQWLVSLLLPRRGFGVLFGPSGCGKSFWGVFLAICVACGLDFLGRSSKQAGVIYCAPEDAEGVKFRTVAALRALDLEIGEDMPIPLAIVPNSLDLANPEGDADALIAAIKAESVVLREMGAPLGLIIIDTYRDALPGLEENDSKQTSAAVRTLRRIGDETRALVLVIAHTAKAGDGEDPRGSSALIGAADVALGVKIEEVPGEGEGEPPSVQRVMWVRKQRNGADAKGDQGLRWAYTLKTVDLDLMGEDGKPEQSCIVQIVGAPARRRPRKAKALKAGSRIVLQAIQNLISNGKGQRPPADIGCPANRSAVRKEDLLEEAARLGISDASANQPAEAVRKAVSRARQDLNESGFINDIGGWIWELKQ